MNTHLGGGQMGCGGATRGTGWSWTWVRDYRSWRERINLCVKIQAAALSLNLRWSERSAVTSLHFFVVELVSKNGWWKNSSVNAKKIEKSDLETNPLISFVCDEKKRGLPKLIRSWWFLWSSLIRRSFRSWDVSFGTLTPNKRVFRDFICC